MKSELVSIGVVVGEISTVVYIIVFVQLLSCQMTEVQSPSSCRRGFNGIIEVGFTSVEIIVAFFLEQFSKPRNPLENIVLDTSDN